jgi:phosphoserine phosphatase RsbU/P
MQDLATHSGALPGEAEAPSPTLLAEQLRALSEFSGDSAAALRTMFAYLAKRWPDCALGLLLVRDLPPGQCRLAGLIAANGIEAMPAADPFGERMRLPVFDDALVQRLIADGRPHLLDLAPNERGLPLAQALLSPASLLALPMFVRGTAVHWLVLASTVRHRLDRIDVGGALREATMVYSMISRSLAVRNLAAESQRQHRAIEGLADVQRLLLPDEPSIRGLEYAIHWQPAETAAGDYYDLMSLTHIIDDYVDPGSDVWALMLADVSGHGAAAAMEAVQFDAILRTYHGDEPPGGPAGALTYANRYFFSRRQRQHFLTIFALSYRPDNRELTYVCAGHPPAFHRTRNGMRLLGKDLDAGIPVGILREHRWENATTVLQPGDSVIVYTDGIVEARDRRERMFGHERLRELIADGGDDPAATIARVRDALFEHQNSETGADDQTLIVLRQTL